MPRNSFDRRVANQSDSPGEQMQSEEITPELVRKIADEIYLMLIQDSRVDFERRRYSLKSAQRLRGGR
jgi:hypothetical protein